ncbi:MAG: AAA family ATPase [Methylomicrobium sp.]
MGKKNKSDNTGYTILKPSIFFNRSAPPIVVLNYIENQIIAKEHKNEKIGLELPSFLDDIAWLAPIRSKPRKTYDEYSLDFSPEGDHTPYLIKKKFDSVSESKRFKEILSDIGHKSGLYKSVEIKNYGRGTTAPFELDVVLSKEPLSIGSVGYGISQSLPVIVEMITRPKNSWFAIQQPEVHLHPKAQAALGEVVFNLATKDNKKFIIETHSDYMIDRFRLSSRKSNKKSESQILFFERTDQGNKLTPISIGDDGEFINEQPAEYREFFIKEEMDLLGL